MELIKNNLTSFEQLKASAGLLSNGRYQIDEMSRNCVFEVEGKVELVVFSYSKNEKELHKLKFEVNENADFSLVFFVEDGAESEVSVSMQKAAQLKASFLQFGEAKIDCVVDMDDELADSQIDILQLVGDGQHAKTNLRIAHNEARCTSRSMSKCLASGKSVGEFHGMVFVAQGANQTEAFQNSRNVALSSEAKIIAEPQLEIYADDVKCSHGATVGQINADAIFYMRQRGLSEEQARKLQLLGYVADIVDRLPIEQLRPDVLQVAKERLNSL